MEWIILFLGIPTYLVILFLVIKYPFYNLLCFLQLKEPRQINVSVYGMYSLGGLLFICFFIAAYFIGKYDGNYKNLAYLIIVILSFGCPITLWLIIGWLTGRRFLTILPEDAKKIIFEYDFIGKTKLKYFDVAEIGQGIILNGITIILFVIISYIVIKDFIIWLIIP